MKRGLMAEEDLDELGFKHTISTSEKRKARKEGTGERGKEQRREGFLGGLTTKIGKSKE